ncbi:KWG Leptospira [compost metagenome]
MTLLKMPFQDSLQLVSQDSKYGIIDSTGGIVVPLIYDQISVNFTIREVFLRDWKYSPENEKFYDFWMNYRMDLGEGLELYDSLLKKEMAIPTSAYNLELAFRTQPFFAAKKEGLWGVINKKNETLIPFEYDFMEEIGQNIFLVKKNNSFEIITSDNKRIVESCDTIIIPLIKIFPMPEGEEFAAYALLIRDNKYGAINLMNRETIQPKYDSLEYCASFNIEDYWKCAFDLNDIGHFNYQNDKYKRVHSYDNVIKYKLDNRIGLLDTRNMQEITPASFDNLCIISAFPNSGQIVQLDNWFTFLTHNNSRLHDKLYDSVNVLMGYYKVYLNSRAGVYNDIGEKVLNLQWDDIEVFYCYDTPYFLVKRNGKYGVVDSCEKKIASTRYDRITYKYENKKSFVELRRKKKLKKVYIELPQT